MMRQLFRGVVGLSVIGLAFSAAGAEGFRADRLMLSWQDDPSSTMTIQWLQSGAAFPLVEGVTTDRDAHVIPDVGEVRIDASLDQWWNEGLELAYLADETHGMPSAQVLNAEARLGWNEQGLLVLVRVSDPEPWENPELSQLWDGDGIELFVSDGVGSDYRYQVIVSPGRGENEARHIFYSGQSEEPAIEGLAIEHASREIDGGYVTEVLLPWSNVPRIEAAEGTKIAFQLYVNRRGAEGGDFRWVGLHPARDASANANAMYPFELGAEAGTAIRARAAIERTEDDRAMARVFARPELAGTDVSIRAGERELGTARFEIDGPRAVAQMIVPEPPQGRRWGLFEVRDETGRLAWIDPPTWQGYEQPEPMYLSYWRSDEGEDEAGRAVTRVQPIESWPGKFRQRVELTGLAAGVEYRFRAQGSERDYGFRTMPAQLTRPVRFAIGGDTRHREDWMRTTNLVALSYDIDFVVWGGDLAYADGREDRIYRWEEWFQANHDGLIYEDGRVVPIIVGIGNHEVQGGYYYRHDAYEPDDYWRQRIAPYFYQLFAFPGQPGYATLDFGDYLSLVMLDSAHSNPVAGEQTDWLDNVLAERQGVPHVFPVYHVPAYPSHRSYDGQVSSEVRRYWVPLFEKYGIRVAFENHDHTYKRTHPIREGRVDPEGIVYIGDGAWGVGTRSGESRDEWYIDQFASERHAIIVTLDGPQQHYLMVNEDGEVIDEYSQTAPQPLTQD